MEGLRAEWTSAATGAPGALEIKGAWPLAAGGKGELKLTASKIDMAPWLRLNAQAGAPGVQSLMLDADETLNASEKGGKHSQRRAAPCADPGYGT